MAFSEAYQEHILNSPEVCSNCMSIVREERTGHVPTGIYSGAVTPETDVEHRSSDEKSYVRTSHFGRTQHSTTVEHTPLDGPTDCRRVFCSCGVDTAFARLWDDVDIAKAQFRELLKTFCRAVETQGISAVRRPLLAHALDAFNDRERSGHAADLYGVGGPTVDECLSRGLEAGIQVAVGRSATEGYPTDSDSGSERGVTTAD